MRREVILIALVALLLLPSAGLAQSPAGPTQAGQYDLSWWSVDGGGTTDSTGGSYTLSGTAGQPDTQRVTGGAYTLASGFWGGMAISYHVFLPLVPRGF